VLAERHPRVAVVVVAEGDVRDVGVVERLCSGSPFLKTTAMPPGINVVTQRLPLSVTAMLSSRGMPGEFASSRGDCGAQRRSKA
jgi:hypothetical protein